MPAPSSVSGRLTEEGHRSPAGCWEFGSDCVLASTLPAPECSSSRTSRDVPDRPYEVQAKQHDTDTIPVPKRILPVTLWVLASLYEFAGGEEALHRLEGTFYASILKDPLLQPLFGSGQPEHVDHLTAFTAESFGGPDRFSRELGFAHLINVHRHLRITEDQRRRFVELYMSAMDAADMPGDRGVSGGRPFTCRVRLSSRDAELECGNR